MKQTDGKFIGRGKLSCMAARHEAFRSAYSGKRGAVLGILIVAININKAKADEEQ